jgi:hypothetical protein
LLVACTDIRGVLSPRKNSDVAQTFVDAVTRGKPDEMAQLPILLLLVLAAASIVYSVWALRDRPLLHLAHLITVALAIPLTFFGAVAIVGWT